MSAEEYRPIIFAGREDRNREYKQSFPWDRSNHGETIAKVTKSILAMSNLRDGGHIIIGVEEAPDPGAGHVPVGVEDDHLQTFSYDIMADFVRNYADPYVAFDLDVVSLDRMDFVVIAVTGFEGSPVICKKSFGNVLSEGVIYVRSKSGRPRSEPITTFPDMRELMDYAIERGVRRYLERQARVGALEATDVERFEQQLGDFA